MSFRGPRMTADHRFVTHYLPRRRTDTHSAGWRSALKLNSTLMTAAASQVMDPLSRGERKFPYQPRWRVISYSTAAAAAETLSEPIRPRSGKAISSSHDLATRGRRPLPSEPITSTTLPR